MQTARLRIILFVVTFCMIVVPIINYNYEEQKAAQTESSVNTTTSMPEIQEEEVEGIVDEETQNQETESQNDDILIGSSYFGYDDALMLHKISVAEAGGESIESMALVMLVVLNRVDSNQFPNSVKEVVFQKTNNVAQFSPTINGSYDNAQPNEKSQQAMELILSGWNESRGALYFEACKGDSWHSRALEFLFEIDGIKFYK